MPIQLASRTYRPERLFCIGKNYAEHVKELGGTAVPEEPVVFMKPATCLVPPGESIPVPTHGSILHHEVEVVVLIGRAGRAIAEADAPSHIAGMALGLDLTLRDVQSKLRKQGYPWELAKAFDYSAPLGPLVPFEQKIALDTIAFECRVNGELRQSGNTGEMIFSIPRLIHYLSGVWELREGDLIFTGTPSGVGPLKAGDTVEITSPLLGTSAWTLA